jgi:signal transduction histidine kinase
MNADQLIQYLSWAVYLAIFAQVSLRALRRPLAANVDIALFFVCSTVIILLSAAQAAGVVPRSPLLLALESSLLLSLPFLLLRLVDDFSAAPGWLLRAAGVALAIFIVITFATAGHAPAWLPAPELVYLIGLLGYLTSAFWREARRTRGVTMRRMRAAAFGCLWLTVQFVLIGLSLGARQASGLLSPLADLAGLLSGVSYYLGFAPPALIRRAWQEPELRSFLSGAARLPRLPDTASILQAMERGAATSVGAPHASIGLWDDAAGVLRFALDTEEYALDPHSGAITGRAFLDQRALYSDNITRDSPGTATIGVARGVRALLIAPITAGERRLGVLVVYAPRAPIFAEEDLALAQLLADQAAVVLESRALIDEAARVRAREEVARLKEDFLSAAAHDLKTPLTTLVAQTQLLERKARRMPDAPADLPSIERLVSEAQRLRTLVLELLDATRAEQGRLVSRREAIDLAEAAREVCARRCSARHPCDVVAEGPVIGEYDPVRILQLTENLVENAVKYSPDGGPVELKVWREDGWNHLTVSDRGIGIPPADVDRLFERFHRGENVDDRRFAGMGLGLYICRGIAEQHGGWIRAEPRNPGGSTFHVALPGPGHEGDHDHG